MKTLSIKQPWASLIAHGIKDIENRTWKTKYRGMIYIHASGKMVQHEFTHEQSSVLATHERIKGFDFSAIIGEVDIVDCVINHHSIWADKTEINTDFEDTNAYFGKPIYNWVLANPLLYDQPILNVKGKLSLWEFDKAVKS
ncbi:ASCH domain-containing protein [Sphingobacterium sp. SGG-5]|uniref:ASCH domain-containing protein n=1 Tax=Sphingobacterium sp. SGG-5 TaxID=2710881 RepID=UPI0013EB4174|nr:ASCH domain-containing protein [Sphingobacterium sp. SGG-5]NGM63528.1 ASCH domain-containing protein [Sphingobacterium sp. SGG-5]